MPPASAKPKKRSRKQQLLDLAAAKKKRRDEAAEAADLWTPAAGHEAIQQEIEDHDDLGDQRVELPGAATARMADAYRHRRGYERLRGVQTLAGSMAAWLQTGESEYQITCANIKSHSPTNDCCCAKLLSVQPDFAAECSALQHLVEARVRIPGTAMTAARHSCFFLPKFHCELNWIERYWGASKQDARSHCLYTLQGLRETVPTSLSQDLSDLPLHLSDREDLPVSPLYLQRRWARISRRYMIEYRKGANACDAIKAVKGQSSKRHRDTNDARSRPIEAAMAALSANM